MRDAPIISRSTSESEKYSEVDVVISCPDCRASKLKPVDALRYE